MSKRSFDTWVFEDDGATPNNRWPVIVHHRVPEAWAPDAAAALEGLLDAGGWPAQWRGGVFDFHHYHSNAHEVLAVAAGRARLRLGGQAGQDIEMSRGDVLILPAGTGHCRCEADTDFLLVAGYPPDQQDWDLCRSGQADIHAARQRIAKLPCPARDPVQGQDGLVTLWR